MFSISSLSCERTAAVDHRWSATATFKPGWFTPWGPQSSVEDMLDPLVNSHNYGKITIFSGSINYKWAIFKSFWYVYQRLKSQAPNVKITRMGREIPPAVLGLSETTRHLHGMVRADGWPILLVHKVSGSTSPLYEMLDDHQQWLVRYTRTPNKQYWFNIDLILIQNDSTWFNNAKSWIFGNEYGSSKK